MIGPEHRSDGIGSYPDVRKGTLTATNDSGWVEEPVLLLGEGEATRLRRAAQLLRPPVDVSQSDETNGVPVFSNENLDEVVRLKGRAAVESGNALRLFQHTLQPR